jgi:hypothetical protein
MSARRAKRRFLLVPILAVGLVAIGMGSPARADQACDSSQMVEPGPTDIKAHGTTHFANASSTQGDLGGGQLTWALRGLITGDNDPNGNLAGFFHFTIDWDDSGLATTSYTSDCVVFVWTSVGHLLNGTYGGNLENPPVAWTDNTGVAQRPQGEVVNEFAEATITLDRVSPRRADLVLDVRNETCFSYSAFFHVNRPNAHALGSKTGNGGRAVCEK